MKYTREKDYLMFKYDLERRNIQIYNAKRVYCDCIQCNKKISMLEFSDICNNYTVQGEKGLEKATIGIAIRIAEYLDDEIITKLLKQQRLSASLPISERYLSLFKIW